MDAEATLPAQAGVVNSNGGEVTCDPLLPKDDSKLDMLPSDCPPVAMVTPQGGPIFLDPTWSTPNCEPPSRKKDSSNSIGTRLFMLWEAFADYTTLHGFRQIAEETEFICRRIFWIIITIFAFGLLLYQMGNSVSLYLSRPVAFNVNRDYKTSLEFPAITICNQNVFRISQAWSSQLYGFLESMYDQKEPSSVVQQAHENMSLVEVLNTMKHRKEDLVLLCNYNRVFPCYVAEDLKKTLVDNSICYTFNSNATRPRKTSLTGSESGLNMLMNIEQYEFMRTSSLTAGIQVFVHDQNSIPREAISIPPGMKAYIRVSSKHVQLLGKPYGVCGSRKLEYYSLYTTDACLRECRENWLMMKCGCHSGILPLDANISSPVCTIKMYSDCILPKLAEYTPAIGECNCPTQCNFRRYNNFISFSEISTFDVNQALKHLPTSTPRKLEMAREVFYRVNHDKREVAEDKTLRPFTNVTNMVHGNMIKLLTTVQRMKREIDGIKDDILTRFLFHKYMVVKMTYAVQNNWRRGWEVARERTFSIVAFDYLPLLYSLELFEQMVNDSSRSGAEIRTYQTLLESRLYEKQQIAQRALDNFTKIHDGFVNVQPLNTFLITPRRCMDTEFRPRSVIRHKVRYEQKYYSKVKYYTEDFVQRLKTMQSYIGHLASRNESFNQTKFHEAKHFIAKRCRNFNYYQYMYEDRIVNRAVTIMQGIKQKFFERNGTFMEAYSRLNYKLTNLLSILTDLEKQYDRSGVKVVRLAENYMSQRTSLDYNLTSLSRLIHDGLAGKTLESFVSGLDSIEVYRLTLEQDMWVLRRALVKAVKSLWDPSTERPYWMMTQITQAMCTGGNVTAKNRTCVEKIAKKAKVDSRCPQLLSSTNSDWMTQGRTKVLRRLSDRWNDLSKAVVLITNVTSLKEELGYTVNNLKRFTFDFLEGNKISRKFVKDNFVEVQIYYQDLVTVEESQSPAYTMTQLWSDFGGNFGLLLGASALSVIEIVDFLIHESLKMRQ